LEWFSAFVLRWIILLLGHGEKPFGGFGYFSVLLLDAPSYSGPCLFCIFTNV